MTGKNACNQMHSSLLDSLSHDVVGYIVDFLDCYSDYSMRRLTLAGLRQQIRECRVGERLLLQEKFNAVQRLFWAEQTFLSCTAEISDRRFAYEELHWKSVIARCDTSTSVPADEVRAAVKSFFSPATRPRSQLKLVCKKLYEVVMQKKAERHMMLSEFLSKEFVGPARWIRQQRVESSNTLSSSDVLKVHEPGKFPFAIQEGENDSPVCLSKRLQLWLHSNNRISPGLAATIWGKVPTDQDDPQQENKSGAAYLGRDISSDPDRFSIILERLHFLQHEYGSDMEFSQFLKHLEMDNRGAVQYPPKYNTLTMHRRPRESLVTKECWVGNTPSCSNCDILDSSLHFPNTATCCSVVDTLSCLYALLSEEEIQVGGTASQASEADAILTQLTRVVQLLVHGDTYSADLSSAGKAVAPDQAMRLAEGFIASAPREFARVFAREIVGSILSKSEFVDRHNLLWGSSARSKLCYVLSRENETLLWMLNSSSPSVFWREMLPHAILRGYDEVKRYRVGSYAPLHHSAGLNLLCLTNILGLAALHRHSSAGRSLLPDSIRTLVKYLPLPTRNMTVSVGVIWPRYLESVSSPYIRLPSGYLANSTTRNHLIRFLVSLEGDSPSEFSSSRNEMPEDSSPVVPLPALRCYLLCWFVRHFFLDLWSKNERTLLIAIFDALVSHHQRGCCEVNIGELLLKTGSDTNSQFEDEIYAAKDILWSETIVRDTIFNPSAPVTGPAASHGLKLKPYRIGFPGRLASTSQLYSIPQQLLLGLEDSYGNPLLEILAMDRGYQKRDGLTADLAAALWHMRMSSAGEETFLVALLQEVASWRQQLKIDVDEFFERFENVGGSSFEPVSQASDQMHWKKVLCVSRPQLSEEHEKMLQLHLNTLSKRLPRQHTSQEYYNVVKNCIQNGPRRRKPGPKPEVTYE